MVAAKFSSGGISFSSFTIFLFSFIKEFAKNIFFQLVISVSVTVLNIVMYIYICICISLTLIFSCIFYNRSTSCGTRARLLLFFPSKTLALSMQSTSPEGLVETDETKHR